MSDNQYQIPLARTANVLIAEGVHPFTIIGGDEGEGAKGPYWSFDIRCDTPSEDNKTMKMFVSLSQQARWRLELFLDAVGAPDTGAATIDKFFNRRFRGSVEIEEYNGRPQAQIKEMFPINSSGAAGVKPTTAVKVAVTDKAKAGKKAPVQAALPADATEEIPF
jgi:hypothetical protein